MTAFAHIGGVVITKLRLVAGSTGPWVAHVELEEDADFEGPVQIVIGERSLEGTIAPQDSGAFGLQRRLTVIGGGGGWGREVGERDYQNDAGVKARTVVDDAAREVGETIGDFAPEASRIGGHYSREAGLASRVLEEAIGSAHWWVDFDGVTHVGQRSEVEADPELYQVLHFEPRTKIATLGVNDPLAVVPGSRIQDTLDAPQTVRDTVLHLQPESMKVVAWCGASGRARAVAAFRGLVGRMTDTRDHGRYEYRVVSMAGDRANLQPVNKSDGLPDLLPTDLVFGLPGMEAQLTPGSQVLVGFAGGRRTQPFVSHYKGKGSPAYVPVSINLCGGAEGAARVKDTVEVAWPPMVFSGTIGGAPATGMLVSPVGTTLGAIKTGSSKVKIGG